MTTTCPSAPRRAFGLRMSTLRRLSGNKCPRIYQTHNMRPNRCDARPLSARWQGEGMTNEETAMKQEVIDRILRSGNVPPGYDGDIDALLSRAYDAGRAAGRGDEIARAAVATNIAMTECGNELRAALGVTAPWDGCIATVRDLVAKDKAKPAPTDAAAESAAVDGLVNEAIRQKGDHIDGHDRTGRWCLSLGDTRFDTRHEVARGWLRPWLLAAWARGVAYGQQPDAPPVLAESFGVASADVPGCGQMRAAAREQVAAERAVDAAAVALSDEDSIRAAFAKSEVEGLKNEAEDLANEVKNLRRNRDSAVAARAEDQQNLAVLRGILHVPANELWPGILRRVRTMLREYAETAAMATVMRQDLPGRVAAAVAPGEDALAAAREEGRKEAYLAAIEDQGDHSFIMTQETAATTDKTAEELRRYLFDLIRESEKSSRRFGWKEAMKSMRAVFDEKINEAKKFEREADRLNGLLSHAIADRREALTHADALHGAMIRVEEAAPRETP